MQNINLMHIGTVLVMIGMLFVIIGGFKSARATDSKTETKIGVGGFIGPIPFGFANEKFVMYFLIIIMAVTMLVWFFMINYK